MQTRLEELLDRARAAIMTADFAGAAAITPEIEAALTDLGSLADPAQLERLKNKALRNAALMDAARKGMRAAHRRMEEIRAVAKGGQTYDGHGKRADFQLGGRLAGRF